MNIFNISPDIKSIHVEVSVTADWNILLCKQDIDDIKNFMSNKRLFQANNRLGEFFDGFR